MQVQEASNKAAAQYDKASSQYGAAKEMITVAEQQLGERLTSENPSSPSPIDLAWQEMLNHATEKVSSFVRKDYESVSETLASFPGSFGPGNEATVTPTVTPTCLGHLYGWS